MRPASLDALTSLRFFAAAAIVLFHMQPTLLSLHPTPVLALGVSFFFVLSGFILVYVYQGALRPKNFYLARFARLWPVHAVTLVIAAMLDWSVLPGSEWKLITNVFLLQAWIPVTDYVYSFNAVSWSVSAEVFFYLLFPLLLTRHWRIVLAAIAAVTVFAFIVLEVTDIASRPDLAPQFSLNLFLYHNPLMRMLEFGVGAAAGRLFLARRINTGTAVEICAVAAVLACVAFSSVAHAALGSAGLPSVAIWFSQSGVMLGFAVLIYVFAHQQGMISKILGWKLLVRLGEISFSTYMIHQLVVRFMVTEQWHHIGVVPTAILALIIIYFGSYALWFLVEVPCRRAIVGRLGRSREKPCRDESPARGSVEIEVPRQQV